MAGKNPNKDAILNAWAKAEAQGTPMSTFVESVKDDAVLKVSIGSLRNWLGLNQKRPPADNAHTPRRSSGPSGSRTALNLMQEFEMQYEQEREHKLHQFLQAKVRELEVELAAAQGALREHEQKMGITPASVDE